MAFWGKAGKVNVTSPGASKQHWHATQPKCKQTRRTNLSLYKHLVIKNAQKIRPLSWPFQAYRTTTTILMMTGLIMTLLIIILLILTILINLNMGAFT
jgi:hypothetical protein